jgi:hypothetical protein
MQDPASLEQLVAANRQYYRALLPPHVSYHIHESGREYLFDSCLGTTRWLWERQKAPNANALDVNQVVVVYVNCVDGRRAWALPIFRSDGPENASEAEPERGNKVDSRRHEVTYSNHSQTAVSRSHGHLQRRRIAVSEHRSLSSAACEFADQSRFSASRTSIRESRRSHSDHRKDVNRTKTTGCETIGTKETGATKGQRPFPASVQSVVENETRHHAQAVSRSPVSLDNNQQQTANRAALSLAPNAEAAKRQARAERFREHLRPHSKRPGASLNAVDVGREKRNQQLQKGPEQLVGTSEALEKTYLRLTQAAQADQVRSLSVLQVAFEQLMSRWERQHVEYSYICEQLKAIRQDLQVQGLGAHCQLTFEVYETHARLAILHDDVAELSQCLSMLKTLYQENHSGSNPNRKEFLGYRILLGLYNGSWLDIRVLLREDKLLADAIAAATRTASTNDSLVIIMQLVTALARQDYFSFIRVRNCLPVTARHLVSWFDHHIDKEALNTIQTAYRPSVPLQLVERLLRQNSEHMQKPEGRVPPRLSHTDNDNSRRRDTKSPQALSQFLVNHGARLSPDGQSMRCERRVGVLTKTASTGNEVDPRTKGRSPANQRSQRVA